MQEETDVVIVGGGLAALACAVRLQESGRQALIVEASDRVGGRVRTDRVDGFLLDRGFQVYLSAYPTARDLFDLPGLGLRAFEPGALVWQGGQFRRLMDVWRRPSAALTTALQPIGNWKDKLLIAKLRHTIARRSVADIWNAPECSTEHYLKTFGFSEAMIHGFFRPFYGGIFLESDLKTSSRFFEFTFKMFAAGSATLPTGGMESLPKQLAARLPASSIRCASPAATISKDMVHLESGDTLQARSVVVATDGTTAARWLPDLQAPEWNIVSSLYFAASASPLNEPIIALNGSQRGLVNNVSVLTDLAKEYAPEGQSLISVSVLGQHEALHQTARSELREWFGAQVDSWRHLRTEVIKQALPATQSVPRRTTNRVDGIYLCGDHCRTPSIEGAIESGLRIAETIVQDS